MFALFDGDVITIAHVGSTLGVGLFIETLVVRTFLVPAIAVLLGRWFCHKPTAITTTTRPPRPTGGPSMTTPERMPSSRTRAGVEPGAFS
jgi:uncharacterized membrane protein YdfJ with MMPL/SSD domain